MQPVDAADLEWIDLFAAERWLGLALAGLRMAPSADEVCSVVEGARSHVSALLDEALEPRGPRPTARNVVDLAEWRERRRGDGLPVPTD